MTANAVLLHAICGGARDWCGERPRLCAGAGSLTGASAETKRACGAARIASAGSARLPPPAQSTQWIFPCAGCAGSSAGEDDDPAPFTQEALRHRGADYMEQTRTLPGD